MSNPLVTCRGPAFTLAHHADGGTVTLYPDGASSPVAVNRDHEWHSCRLGGAWTAARYNLAHELSHHLVGVYVLGRPSSPVVWRSAHGLPMEDPARELEEWLATALTYHAAGADVADWGALMDVQKVCSPARLAALLRWLLAAADLGCGLEVLLPCVFDRRA